MVGLAFEEEDEEDEDELYFLVDFCVFYSTGAGGLVTFLFFSSELLELLLDFLRCSLAG